jgi:hypothetical protein
MLPQRSNLLRLFHQPFCDGGVTPSGEPVLTASPLSTSGFIIWLFFFFFDIDISVLRTHNITVRKARGAFDQAHVSFSPDLSG